MTINVISVGISILDVLADPDDKLAAKRDIIWAIRDTGPAGLLADAGIGERDRAGASDWLAAAFAASAVGATGPRGALTAAVAAVRPAEWPLDMSAETETFAHAQRTGGFSLDGGDIAVLVCSDTPLGLLAGAWNALAITGGDLGRVRYIPDASDPAARFGGLRGHAVLVRVTGMDARDSSGFQQAMSGLGLLGRQLFASGELKRAEEFRFCLSGGFKVAIPYLIGMAEAVRSVDVSCLERLGQADLMPDAGPWPVKAYMLHETAQETAEPNAPAIELPLRRLVAQSVRKELTGWEGGRRAGKPDRGLLDGYAYDVADGSPGAETYELTAFGTGLRALFGLSREGLG